jgi:putative ABC transport system permease protein
MVPAWRASRNDAAATLKEGGKTTNAPSGGRARRVLVVTEMALAVTMLSGAGMLLRSLWHLQDAGLGFDPRGVLTAKVSISAREYDDARSAIFYEQLITRLSAIPGVRAAGAAGWLPVVDAGGLWGYQPEGGNYPEGRWPSAVPQQITPGYFKAMGMHIVAGRDVSANDRENGLYVAVVSQKFAAQSWPGEDALGKRFQLGGSGSDAPAKITVVGIVDDLRARGFGDVPEPTMYFPYAQTAKAEYYMPRPMALFVRVDGDPLTYTAAMRKEVHALDRTAPVAEIRSLEQVAGLSIALRRFNTTLLAAFAALALVLTGIGTYGVISYGVSQRRFEIGVRMALGAEGHAVMRLVMSEGLRLAAIGLVIGLFASIAVGRAIRAMLVGVAAVDVPSLVLPALLLVIVAAVASLLPALRALRVNPLEALRSS